jgi:hypothetical protein
VGAAIITVEVATKEAAGVAAGVTAIITKATAMTQTMMTMTIPAKAAIRPVVK